MLISTWPDGISAFFKLVVYVGRENVRSTPGWRWIAEACYINLHFKHPHLGATHLCKCKPKGAHIAVMTSSGGFCGGSACHER